MRIEKSAFILLAIIAILLGIISYILYDSNLLPYEAKLSVLVLFGMGILVGILATADINKERDEI